MQRRGFLRALGATALASAAGAARVARAAETLKFATVLPKASLWGKAIETWAATIQDKTGGQLTVEVSYGGAHGEEAATIGKIKTGALDGAFVTSEGLSKVYKPIVALEMPGLFPSWGKLDAARTAIGAEIEKGATEAGFRLAGWADVGVVRALSKGFAVKVPENLKGKLPWSGIHDPIWPAVYAAIGGVSGVTKSHSTVHLSLKAGEINAVHAGCLFAEHVKWAPELDNLNAMPMAFSLGGIVFGSKRVDALATDLRTTLLETSKATAAGLMTKVRAEDNAALTRLKGKMTVTTPSDEDVTKWKAVFKTARAKLAQGTFSSDLVTKLEGYSG